MHEHEQETPPPAEWLDDSDDLSWERIARTMREALDERWPPSLVEYGGNAHGGHVWALEDDGRRRFYLLSDDADPDGAIVLEVKPFDGAELADAVAGVAMQARIIRGILDGIGEPWPLLSSFVIVRWRQEPAGRRPISSATAARTQSITLPRSSSARRSSSPDATADA